MKKIIPLVFICFMYFCWCETFALDGGDLDTQIDNNILETETVPETFLGQETVLENQTMPESAIMLESCESSQIETVMESYELQQEAVEETENMPTLEAYSGFVSQGGFLFYFEPTTGKKVTGFKTINGNTYYFYPPSGAALSGYQKIDGKEYYFDPSNCVMRTGIIEIDYGTKKQKHYFLKGGGLASGWVSENGKSYYFSSPESGSIMLTGVQNIDGKVYYLDETTGEKREGIFKNNQGKAYYYMAEGGIKTGLQEWQGDLYFLKETKSGEVQYGFQSVGTNLYYFDPITGAAWKNTVISYGHMSFAIGSNGVVNSIIAEEGFENNIRTELILNGLKLIGEPYSFDKTKGFACGSFVQYVYSTIGIDLDTSSDQQAKSIVEGTVGTLISSDELRIGDLVFWSLDSCSDSDCTHWNEIHHVGIYLGNGKMLEASESRGGVVVQDIHSFDQFVIRYYGRVIKENDAGYLDESKSVGKSTGVKAVSAGKNKVKLTWDSTEGAEGYLIYAQKNRTYAYCGMTTKGTTFTDTKALDTDYNFYWVFPYKKNFNDKMIVGGAEKYVYAKGVCSAVTNLKASSVSGGVKLSWMASPDAEGYLVYGIVNNGCYKYTGMTTRGTTFADIKASKTVYNYYWVFPYHKDSKGKIIVGGMAPYTYGRAK